MAPLQYEIKQKSASPGPPQILDIQREKLALSLEGDILDGLIGKAENEKTLPTMLLYSAEGLKLYEDITYLDEYYLTNTEIELLEQYADEMAKRIHDGSIVLELGSGNLRKVNILLEALDRQGKQIDYYALDLDLSELKRTLDMAPHEKLKNVRLHGLHGTYEDGQAWLKTAPEIKDRPRCILWMGSSVGNCLPTEAAEFLKSFVGDALRPGKPDYMLIGVDGCKDPEKVYTAYNDPHGVTRQFIMSGLKNANRILGGEYFKQEEWEYLGEWNAELGRHQAYLLPKKDIEFGGRLKGVFLKKGERVNIEYSYKLDDGDAKKCLWEEAGLVEGAQWANASGNYSLNLLQRLAFWFPSTPELYAPGPVPSLSAWQELWTSWETVTLGMIPRNQLLSKPIDLRNPCIFYLGHIPTFLDHLLNLSTGYNPTSPASYLDIFQRGIDPDVDNPSLCHNHSEIPDTWPDLEEILDYQQRVRNRLRSLYRKGSVSHQPLDVKRAIFLAFEHEAMHLETLLYMLVQSDATLSPPNTITPDFGSPKATEWQNGASKGDMWVDIPGMKLNIGMNDTEGGEAAFFGWDNEKPVQKNVEVQTFKARAYPITNEEYLKYLDATGNDSIPASWNLGEPAAKVSSENGHANENGATNGNTAVNGSNHENRGELFVKTVYGAVPMKYALDWPVMASYDELSGCAAWMNARIPTANEVRAIYRHAEASDVSVEKKISTMIDAVNGHLVHNGVCESPPSNDLNAARSSLFAQLTNKNVGLRHWHPTSVRAQGGKLLGRGETGGAWEWTSTVLEQHEDFKPEKFYPEYTADFFDGKHNIVLGGSWATHPRIAGRKTFVNWYQRNYPYVWATARIVKN